jgi:hypothetical protein
MADVFRNVLLANMDRMRNNLRVADILDDVERKQLISADGATIVRCICEESPQEGLLC